MADGDSTLERIRQRMTGINEEKFDTGYNIVMLGTSGVGKTAFMTTMLYDLMTSGSRLRIDTPDQAQKNKLLESHSELRAGKDISPTGRHESWRFQVLYDSTNLFSFRWIDYRGGAVNPAEIIQKQSDKEVNAILDILKLPGTLAVFVLADAERFQKEPPRVIAELEGIRFILEECLKDSGVRNGLQVLLVLTKCDVIALERKWFLWRDWNRDKMLRSCMDVFSPVFLPFIQKNQTVLCDAVPLSSFGTSSMRDPNGMVKIKAGVARIESYQIDVPLRMAFKYILNDLQTSRIPAMVREAEVKKSSHQVALPPWWHIFADRRDHREAIRNCEALLAYLQQLSISISRVVAETERLNPVCWHLP